MEDSFKIVFFYIYFLSGVCDAETRCRNSLHWPGSLNLNSVHIHWIVWSFIANLNICVMREKENENNWLLSTKILSWPIIMGFQFIYLQYSYIWTCGSSIYIFNYVDYEFGQFFVYIHWFILYKYDRYIAAKQYCLKGTLRISDFTILENTG